MMIWPSCKTAERALSVKTLTPLLNDKPSVLRCNLLGPGQLPDLKPLRLAQLHSLLYFEHSLPAAIAHVNISVV